MENSSLIYFAENANSLHAPKLYKKEYYPKDKLYT